MDKSGLTVLWPDFSPPPVFEIQFAYQFCKRQSRKLCSTKNSMVTWIDYTEAEHIDAVLKQTAPHDFLLVIKDPMIVLNNRAVERLLHAVNNGYIACGPVFNDSAHKDQRANLDFSYHNLNTYLEVSQIVAAKPQSDAFIVDQLDPGCILYAKDALGGTAGGIPVVKTDEHVHGRKGVDPGAMVHRFGKAFESAREDLIALIPGSVTSVLDVGCAMGGYGKRLRTARPDIFLAGVEVNPVLAQSARLYYDDIFVCSAESVDLPYQVDLINCGELLEHLENPWEMLNRFNRMLKQSGYIVLSVPNAGHWSIVRDLMAGRFQYLPSGPQCITHVRWFTEADMVEALEQAGFSIDWVDRVKFKPTPAGAGFIQDMIEKGYGNQDQLLTVDIIIRAQKK